MNVFQSCSDTSDITPLSSSQGLYLKPVARLHISVQLPTLKTPGKSISNWEVMEKLRNYAVPDEFVTLKVSKSTLEVVRFEGEIENRSKIPAVLARLDGRSIKLSGFRESLKVRAVEAKPDFPTRHSWDKYFRDAKNMNEMKPGERPDTIHIMNLPCKWFATKIESTKPSEYVLRRVFGAFGELRCVDIPSLDPFRSQMKSYISGIKMFSNNQNLIFEAYVQYKEYIHFVKAMDALRGMKLVHKDADGKAISASIKVDFDTSKHLSESFIRRRKIERDKLMTKEQEKEEQEKKAREEEAQKLARERKRVEEEKAAKLERQRQREERRKQKQMERLTRQEADEMNQKIATEEKLLLMAQRRLESFRLLGELFNRLKIAKENKFNLYKDEVSYRRYRDQIKNQKRDMGENANLDVKEKELREKLVKKFKSTDGNERKATNPTSNYEDNIDYNNDFEHEHNRYDNSEFDHQKYNFDGNRGFSGAGRGGRRNWNRGGRRGMNFRGQPNLPFGPIPFQPFPNQGFFPPRGFPRWPRFPPRGRGDGGFGFMPPFIDPLYLETAMSDPYYKYFQKLTQGERDKRTRSRSRSRSRTRSRSRYRSHSRSRSYSSRSYSRSRSRSYSRSSSRSKTRSRSRSRNRSRRKKQSRSQRRSRSQKSNRRTRSRSLNRSNKELKDKADDKVVEYKTNKTSDEIVASVHSWSRSPSKARSDSWENRKDEPSSSTKEQKHKKDKKKREKRKKKKKSDHD